MASEGPVFKLLPCLSKENCLHIGVCWRGINRIMGPVMSVVCVGTVRLGALVRLGHNTLWMHVKTVCLRAHPWPQLQKSSVDKVVTQFTLIRAETVHIPLFVKLPAVCFHYFCYTFYLYLNVLGNLRTNVKVKMQYKRVAWCSRLHADQAQR